MEPSMARTIKIVSWNVNGIRSAVKKGFLEWLTAVAPEILCVQETKLQHEQILPELMNPEGYTSHWNCARKKGYSGVATFLREMPLSVSTVMGQERFDDEGRFIRTDFKDFTLFNVYFPNGKMSGDRLRFKMDFYDYFLDMMEKLRKEQPRIIFVGDVNTAHNEIDLARPKENSKVSGFLPIERQWMDKVASKGYLDTFRNEFPSTVQYSWWDMKSRARERNIGWRIDYVFVTREMAGSVKKSFVWADVMGSDHCPVGIELETESGSV